MTWSKTFEAVTLSELIEEGADHAKTLGERGEPLREQFNRAFDGAILLIQHEFPNNKEEGYTFNVELHGNVNDTLPGRGVGLNILRYS